MQIILFRGRPGVGKTTLTNEYIKHHPCFLIRKDDLYDIASEVLIKHSDRNKVAYNGLYKMLHTNAASSVSVILDYPFQHDGDMDIIRSWCAKHDIVFKSVLVTCSDKKLWSKRLSARSANPKPNQLVTDYDEFEKMYGTMQLEPEADELVVDSIDLIETIIEQVRRFVE